MVTGAFAGAATGVATGAAVGLSAVAVVEVEFDELEALPVDEAAAPLAELDAADALLECDDVGLALDAAVAIAEGVAVAVDGAVAED